MIPSRQLDKAREAYENRDVQAAREAHGNLHNIDGQFRTYDSANIKEDSKTENILEQHKEEHFEGAELVKSAMYGGFDGILTTFALVMSFVGGDNDKTTVLTVMSIGIANLFADGMSMGVADYFSSKSEQELTQREREREQWEVENNIEGEKQEMYEIYIEKGMEREDARLMTDLLAKNPKAFVDIMMVEELGLITDDSNPMINGLVTFFSFVLFGCIPILPFVYGAIAKIKNIQMKLWLPTICLTCGTLFILGVGKSRYAQQSWWASGLQTLIIGSLAAASSYLINFGFSQIPTDD